MSDSRPILEVADLGLRFGGTAALEDVSFSMPRGHILGLIGPNGAGKSSLLNCICGVYRASHGSIRLDGDDITKLAPFAVARRGVARTFQNIVMFPGLTVTENLLMGRYVHKRSGSISAALRLPRARRDEQAQRERVDSILTELELDQYRRQLVDTLPYGVLKQLEVGRALAMEPKLLLLDEPLAGMNQSEKEDMAAFILRVHASHCPHILFIEHDMRMMMSLAKSLVVLDFGRKIAQGPPEAIQRDPEVLRAYLGTSRTETPPAVERLLEGSS